MKMYKMGWFVLNVFVVLLFSWSVYVLCVFCVCSVLSGVEGFSLYEFGIFVYMWSVSSSLSISVSINKGDCCNNDLLFFLLGFLFLFWNGTIALNENAV